MRFRSFYRIFFLKYMRALFKPGISRVRKVGLITVCLGYVATAQAQNAQGAIENITHIQTQVAQFLTDEYTKTQTVTVDVKVGNLDQRLRLARCDQKLALNLKDPLNSGGNLNVQVSCKGSAGWTILVPAQAKVYRSVAVASRTLQRGDVVAEGDLTQDVKDVSEYRLGFALSPDAIIGKEIKFTINKGEVFRNSALDAPMVIKRGDAVTMEAAAGEISVKTNGTAITDGRVGQQIRVKNNQSARVVNVRVVAAGKVQSIM